MEKLTLGGKVFEIQEELTAECDVWMMRIVRDNGLTDLTVAAGEAYVDFVRRITEDIMVKGVLFRLLAGALTPEGVEWTPAVANETEEFLRKLRSPEDKAAMRVHVLDLLIGFFRGGMRLWTTSQSSSSAEGIPAESSSAQ